MESAAADIAIDTALVSRLVRAQHPDLAGPLVPVANGWDNAIYRLGDELCVRLPRRTVAAVLIAKEHRWLSVIARHVTVPVPVPVRRGVPGSGYPWPWTIASWFGGQPASDLPLAARRATAGGLAGFMAELHIRAPWDAPRNPVRGGPLAQRTPAVLARLASGTVPRAEELRQAWHHLSAVRPWTEPPLWVHGDPHPANFLLAGDRPAGGPRLAAVIDFGDLTAGDPATDLAAAWLVFDAHGRAVFRARVDDLTGTDAATWERARGWALSMASAMAMQSLHHPAMAAIGERVIDQVLADP